MSTDHWTPGDATLTAALRALYAAPTDEGYWDSLEARILSHLARGDERSGWYGELADMVRPGLIAAAGLILVAGLAMMHSRQDDARSAYATVISPASAGLGPATHNSSVGDGDAAIHFILSH
jgi:hypothetical protein